MNEWTQIKATGRRELLDTMCAVMSMIDAQIQIEDYGDLDELMLDGVYGDLIDEEVKNADREHASVSVYLPRERSLSEAMSFLRERFAAAAPDGGVTVETVGMSEEDWAETWKKYYHPVKVGRAVIVPAWEKYDPEPGEITVTMDPGMAFGTGTHETTRLVIGLIDKYLARGGRVLDVGCGSGILSICAAKLGAGRCFAYDIDPVAVRVAEENVRANGGGDRIVCGTSDLLASVDREEKYDLIVANIVADIILRMSADVGDLLARDGVLIVSGIIDERANEVTDAFLSLGYTVVEEAHENGWCAAALKKIQ